eukprot:3527387-Rhodomonas_salina.2
MVTEYLPARDEPPTVIRDPSKPLKRNANELLCPARTVDGASNPNIVVSGRFSSQPLTIPLGGYPRVSVEYLSCPPTSTLTLCPEPNPGCVENTTLASSVRVVSTVASYQASSSGRPYLTWMCVDTGPKFLPVNTRR